MSEVTITLGGKERRLRFDFNALADLDQACPGVVERYTAGTQAGFGAARGLLWAALKHEAPRLTLAQAGDLLYRALLDNEITLLDVLVKLNQTLIASGLFKSKATEDSGPPTADEEEKKTGLSADLPGSSTS